MKKISVSLLVFNESHNLEKTIIQAYKELEKLYLEFELWILDNCSNDGTDVLVNSLLKKYKNLRTASINNMIKIINEKNTYNKQK